MFPFVVKVIYCQTDYFICCMYPVADSLELIERDYVLVNSHCASTDTVCSSLEASVQDISESRHSLHPLKTTGKCIAVQKQAEELSSSSVYDVDSLGSHGPVPLEASQALVDSADVRSLHPSMKLRSLHQYVHALSELAQEKVCLSYLMFFT